MNSAEIKKFQKDQLDEINRYRAIHQAPPLVLDEKLTEYSQKWANHLAKTGKLAHQPDQKYGENVAAGSPWKSLNPAKLWYSEAPKANYSNLESSMNCLHFTQLVWWNSKKLGLGVAVSASGMGFVVANFDPPGNVRGQFGANVSPPKK
uniref:SCP domain-containing protein n=1 Tax=Panagrolaimus sp. JU765 TaxID=591449 RepID=A0AC34RBI2_9BILA